MDVVILNTCGRARFVANPPSFSIYSSVLDGKPSKVTSVGVLGK